MNIKYLLLICILGIGCGLTDEIDPNTPGFVESKLTGDRIRFYIDSDQPRCILTITKGEWTQDWVIKKRFYQCNEWAYESGTTYEIVSKKEYFKSRP